MAWQTPKTNWKISDFLNYADYNRIVGNIDYLKTEISAFIGSIDEYVQLDKNKNYASVVYSEEMNGIENNLDMLNTYTYNLDIGEKTSYTINGSTPLFSEFNRIENACALIKERVDSQKNNNTAPTINVTSDYSGWTQQQTFALRGSITDNGNGIGFAKVIMSDGNSIDLPLDSNNNFRVDLPLKGGSNKFVIRTIDNDYNPSAFKFTVKQDNKAPSIVITSPTGYMDSSSYTLTGRVTELESGIQSVTVNGESITLNSNGTFSKAYTLSGTTVFTVEARDIVGNRSIVTHTATYDTSSHTATLTTSLITKRSATSSTNASYSHNGFDSGQQGNNYYVSRRRREQCDGMGNDISATATYKGTVNVTALPDWEHIKRIVINRYGSSAITKYLDGTITTIDFTDTSTSSTGVHIVGDYGDVTAKAGISSLKYYYG